MRSYPRSRKIYQFFGANYQADGLQTHLISSIRHTSTGIRRKLMKRSALLAFAVAGVLGSTETLAQNAYITNNQSNSVSVIDTPTNEVTATVSVGAGPWGVAVSPDGRKVYTANWYYTVSAIDTATNAVTSIPNIWNAIGGNTIGIAVSQDGRRVYATNFYQQSVSVIDTATNTVIAAIPVSGTPYLVAVTPDGSKLYVTDFSDSTVSVISTASNAVIATISVGPSFNPAFPAAGAVAVTPDGSKVYVATYTSNTAVISTATDTVTATIPLLYSYSVAVSPDGTRVYIAGGNHVNGYDVATNQHVVGSDYIGAIGGISVTPDGRKVYAANFDANEVFVVDAVTGAITAALPVGNEPLAFGNFIQPRPAFAGTPGKANCHGKSVSALTQQYGGLNNAAAALGYPSVSALQNAIEAYCEA
jgi:YVTN family beta-propeller protein